MLPFTSSYRWLSTPSIAICIMENISYQLFKVLDPGLLISKDLGLRGDLVEFKIYELKLELRYKYINQWSSYHLIKGIKVSEPLINLVLQRLLDPYLEEVLL